jgi:hypothetical protein
MSTMLTALAEEVKALIEAAGILPGLEVKSVAVQSTGYGRENCLEATVQVSSAQQPEADSKQLGYAQRLTEVVSAAEFAENAVTHFQQEARRYLSWLQDHHWCAERLAVDSARRVMIQPGSEPFLWEDSHEGSAFAVNFCPFCGQDLRQAHNPA